MSGSPPEGRYRIPSQDIIKADQALSIKGTFLIVRVYLGIKKVLETCLYVDDLEAAEAFYKDVLELELHSKKENRHLFFSLENQMLLLFKPETTLPDHGAKGPGHVAFDVKSEEVDIWKEKLLSKSIEIESEHTWPNGA